MQIEVRAMKDNVADDGVAGIGTSLSAGDAVLIRWDGDTLRMETLSNDDSEIPNLTKQEVNTLDVSA